MEWQLTEMGLKMRVGSVEVTLGYDIVQSGIELLLTHHVHAAALLLGVPYYEVSDVVERAREEARCARS